MTTPPATVSEEPTLWARLHGRLHCNRAMSVTTKIAVTLVGAAVLAGGVVMMATPGPGLVGIAAGLAILATEWAWADRWLQAARRKLDDAIAGESEEVTQRRKRRALVTTVMTAGTAALATAYVAVKDWPGWSLDAWGKAQSFTGFLPDLPGM